MRTGMKGFRLPATIALAGALAACAEPPPPPPPPTTVALEIVAGADLNGGVPAKVQIFYLSSTAAFEAADYFSLADNAQATLGADLIAADEYLMQPGATVTAAKTFDIAPAAIGAVAGFRSVDQPGWRTTGPIAANAANKIDVSVGADTITVSAAVE